MKFKLFLLCLTSFFTTEIKAWNNSPILGARAISTGNCGLTTNDLWAVSNNPASMAFNNKSTVGISVQNRFGISNLNAGAIAVNLVSDFGALGMYTNVFGTSAYREHNYGLSFSKSLLPNFAMGLTIYYSELYVNDYGYFGAPAFNLGFVFPFNKNLIGAFKINNPTQSKISQLDYERTTSSAAFGLNHKVATNTSLYIESEVYQKHQMDFRCGFEYSPSTNSAVRAGFSTITRSVSFGLSFEKSIAVTIGFNYHNRLGYTSTFDSQFNFGKTNTT